MEEIVIDATKIKKQLSECKEWMGSNKGKNPPQERDTAVAIALWEQILKDSKPLNQA